MSTRKEQNFADAKRVPLSKVWLAAHWENKVKKAHVLETNNENSVNRTLATHWRNPLSKYANLMLGIVRIYSRQTKYLLRDCATVAYPKNNDFDDDNESSGSESNDSDITKTKRIRKLIIDENTRISRKAIKNQLNDTSDIVSTLDLTPPSRRLMHWKETWGVEELSTLPARPIASSILLMYQRNMTARTETEEGESRALSPETETERKRRRPKRKHEEIVTPEAPALSSVPQLYASVELAADEAAATPAKRRAYHSVPSAPPTQASKVSWSLP